jgi:pimeloyl-ACP methyl ester carboxylesterase
MTVLSSMVETNTRRIREIADGLLTRVAPNVPLSRPIDAEEKTMTTHRGQTLAYYDDRTKHGERPLVLLHSVNACASSYEMRPLFEHYRHQRPTYALDLPGFGLSGREDRPYTIDLFVDSVRELLGRVRERDGEADVVALSLAGEFAAHVAVAQKDLVHSLALLSPTGFDESARQRSSLERLERPLKVVRREPVVSRLVFDAIASHPSISYFLRKSFVGKPHPGLVDYAYATSHQPGAHHAPLAFLAGELFTPNVREEVYARVSVPSLVVHDTDPYVRFDALPAFVASHAHWHFERVVPTRGMPQFEQLEALTRTLDSFWHLRAHATTLN